MRDHTSPIGQSAVPSASMDRADTNLLPSPPPSAVSEEHLIMAALPTSRAKWGLLVAFVLIAVAGGAAYALTRPSTMLIPVADPPAVPVRRPTPVPALVAPPPLAVEAVSLHVRSTPTGASVHRASDDVLLGNTPLEIRVDRGSPSLDFFVRLEGHKEVRATLEASANAAVDVDLKKIPKRVRTIKRKVRNTPPKQKSLGKGTLLDPFAD